MFQAEVTMTGAAMLPVTYCSITADLFCIIFHSSWLIITHCLQRLIRLKMLKMLGKESYL